MENSNEENNFRNIFWKKPHKTNQTKFRVEKVIKRNVINYMLGGKVILISLIAR